jgi:mycobactin lysine-N-oxygenase
MRIVVVGCGPKALAIYAKAKELQQAGFKVPEVCIIEKSEVAANWCGGSHGFTDGAQALGTPPEKDIGFPYDSEYKCWEVPQKQVVDQFLFRYSWPSFKIARRNYADWLDRSRPAPRHSDWADYLKWVAQELQLEFESDLNRDLRRGIIKTVRKDRGQWIVNYAADDTAGSPREQLVCDAIVFTGPGEPKRIKNQATHDMILDGESFWTSKNLDHIRYRYRDKEKKIAVIGAGETAASITSALWKMTDSEKWTINIISRRGTLYTRGEGYHENRHFSNPKDWCDLHVSLREELIERTDRGVLSRKAIELITEAKNVHFLQGEVTRISSTGEKARVTIKRFTEDENGTGKEETEDYDCVIVALGFDPFSFCSCFDGPDLGPVYCNAATERRKKDFYANCTKAIAKDLSVMNLEPKLYLPMLAGLMQGPGFPNLSCLGSLSDRILKHSIQILNPNLVPGDDSCSSD